MAEASDNAELQFAVTGINRFVYAYIRSLPDLSGRVVLDIPAGDGRASQEFLRKGAIVKPLDLFPEFLKVSGLEGGFGDMGDPLPLSDASVDIVMCQEGIEHVPDQLGLLNEFNRVLKPGGRLLLTTPSLSHVRARVSHMLFETDLWRRMPPTELDSVWFSESRSDRIYFGHLFLLGVHHLRTICSISGFEIRERIRTQIGWTSVFLGVLLYPLLVLTTLITYRTYSKKKRDIPSAARKRIWGDHVRLNLSPKTLFCKHIFWVLEKRRSSEEQRLDLVRLVDRSAGTGGRTARRSGSVQRRRRTMAALMNGIRLRLINAGLLVCVLLSVGHMSPVLAEAPHKPAVSL
ncbi:MAG: class I SAM-dependent methyltransferase, partial [Gammaproteobacteria bacterium]